MDDTIYLFLFILDLELFMLIFSKTSFEELILSDQIQNDHPLT